MSWELTREQLLREVSAPVTRPAAPEPIDIFDRDICARIDITGPGWTGQAVAAAPAADPSLGEEASSPASEVALHEPPRSASASGEFVIGGQARERRTTLVYGETEDDAAPDAGVGAAYAIGPGPSAVEVTVQGSGTGASMPTSAPVVFDEIPDRIGGDGPTPAQPLSLDDISAPPDFGTQAPTTNDSFAEPKLEGALVGHEEASSAAAVDERAQSPDPAEPGAPVTVDESADALEPVGETAAEAVPQLMPDPVPEVIPDAALPVSSAAASAAGEAASPEPAVEELKARPTEVPEGVDTESPRVETETAPDVAEADAASERSEADVAKESSAAPETEPSPVAGDDAPDEAAKSEPADSSAANDDGRTVAPQVEARSAEADAAPTPSLFIPLSLMRPAIEEVEEPPVAEGMAAFDEPSGEPEPVTPSDSGVEEVEEFEEIEEVQEHEAQGEAGADAGAPAPRAKRPPAPPEAKRKRAWYDDVFGEHFQEIAPARTFEAAERDAEFLDAVLQLPDGASILDVGCGAGRHAIALGKRGFEVTGIDSALSQLLAAGQNLESVEGPVSVSFMHGDMRSLPADRDYDAIVCLGTSFGYFEEDQNRLCAEGMRERLRDGGRLVLQVFNRDFLAHHLPCRSWWHGKKCMVLDEAEMNFFANRLRVHRTVIFEDGRQFEHYMFIRAFSVHDLGKMLSGIGMKVLEVSGSRETRGRFYGADSPEIWIVAERRPD